MVLVPVSAMRMAAVGLRIGLYPKMRMLRIAMDEIATCLHFGYHFLKGGDAWRHFYKRVSTLRGVRLVDKEIVSLAAATVCDVLWVLQKVRTGELLAAQHVLHSRISDVNLKLWRELQLRQGRQLLTFGLGRGLEAIANESRCDCLAISAELHPKSLSISALKAHRSLLGLMSELVPHWTVPLKMEYRIHGASQPFV